MRLSITCMSSRYREAVTTSNPQDWLFHNGTVGNKHISGPCDINITLSHTREDITMTIFQNTRSMRSIWYFNAIVWFKKIKDVKSNLAIRVTKVTFHVVQPVNSYVLPLVHMPCQEKLVDSLIPGSNIFTLCSASLISNAAIYYQSLLIY